MGLAMTVVMKSAVHESSVEEKDLKTSYIGSLKLIEQLHRLLLDVIKDEFERLGRADVNSIQALLLYNIGDDEVTAGELTGRGYYLGSNVSYNLKKLVQSGFVNHQRSTTDRRSVRVSLTEKGREVSDVINGLFERQLGSLEQVGGVARDELDSLNKSMFRLQRFWSDQIRYQL